MTASISIRAHLTALAKALRQFHSALLDVAKSEYEFREGPIGGPFALYSLVMNHGSFQWLRPLSGLMATLDEVTDSKTELSGRNVQDVKQALELLMGGPGSEEAGPQFADFRAGYARASADPKVKAAEAHWRDLLRQAGADSEQPDSEQPASGHLEA